MSRDDGPKNFSEYKAKQLEIRQKIQYHENQENYHRANRAAAQAQLEELERTHSTWQEAHHKEKAAEARLSIQEVADKLAIDRETVEERIARKKAAEMYKILMKGYK